MSRTLHLTIAAPAALIVDVADVTSLRAEDASGGFGLLPGCADLLTVLPASVVRWRTASGAESFCALRGGALTVKGGARVSIACREGLVGVELPALEREARAYRVEQLDAAARARVEQTRLHAGAVRQLIRWLRPAGLSDQLFADGDGGGV